MRRMIVIAIITALCVTACGNTNNAANDNTTPAADSSESLDTSQVTEEAASDTSEESVMEANADEESEASDTSESNTSESETPNETIQITLDNWDTYLTIEDRLEPWNRDDDGAIIDEFCYYDLVLRPEYKDNAVSLTGNVVYEYECALHTITDIEKDTGDIETVTYESELPQWLINPLSEVISDSKSVDLSIEGSTIITASAFSENSSTGAIIVKESDTVGEQFIIYPEDINTDIRFIDIEGELVLRS